MKPPICVICGKRFGNEVAENKGGLVSFTATEEEKVYNLRLKEPGFTGHPANKEWFCGAHFDQAFKLKNLNKTEALSELRSLFLY